MTTEKTQWKSVELIEAVSIALDELQFAIIDVENNKYGNDYLLEKMESTIEELTSLYQNVTGFSK